MMQNVCSDRNGPKHFEPNGPKHFGTKWIQTFWQARGSTHTHTKAKKLNLQFK